MFDVAVDVDPSLSLEIVYVMDDYERLLALIRKGASQRILFSQHAVRQMARPDRLISTTEIRMVLEQGEIIEDYPEDRRGHNCLIPR